MRRIGIIGAGRIAGVHARHLRALGAGPFLVHDRDPARAAALGEGLADADEIIAAADIVLVCTPPDSHREFAERAAAAGKAVFLEKPISLTLEDADALVALEESGAFVAVGHVVRFFPAYAAARAAILAGRIGRPAVARLFRGGGFPGADGRAWYGDHDRSGGVLVDLAIHDLDWLLWTFGPARGVTARSIAAARGSGPDQAVATIEFASGALAHVEASWMESAPFRTSFDLAGSDGLLEFDSRQATNVGGDLVLGAGDDPYALQWRAIFAALDAGGSPPVTARDGRDALALALAARDSSRAGSMTRGR